MTSMLYAQEEKVSMVKIASAYPAEKLRKQTRFYRRYISPAVKPEIQEIQEIIHNKNAVDPSQQVEQYSLSSK